MVRLVWQFALCKVSPAKVLPALMFVVPSFVQQVFNGFKQSVQQHQPTVVLGWVSRAVCMCVCVSDLHHALYLWDETGPGSWPLFRTGGGGPCHGTAHDHRCRTSEENKLRKILCCRFHNLGCFKSSSVYSEKNIKEKFLSTSFFHEL